MKRNFLSMFVLASLFVTGCTHEEIAPNGGDENNGNGKTSYLSVNIVSSDATGTRADDDVYEEGTGDENTVNHVRFYFFTANGAPADVKIKNDKYVNYYDWDKNINTTPNTGNVEKILDATIVINTKTGDQVPQMIAAVLNPDFGVLDDDPKRLTELKNLTNNYKNLVYHPDKPDDKPKFVMFNSVFGKNSKEFCAVPIEAKHLATTEEAAKNSPVDIYVERCVAKVRVSLGIPDTDYSNNMIILKDKTGKNIKVNTSDGEKQVYLKLNNWRLTAETNNGRLVKKIDTTWTSDWWNDANNFRSRWAINADNAQNEYGNYNVIDKNFGNDYSLYTNENALSVKPKDAGDDYTAPNNTKVIIGGTLCDAEGNAYTLVRHLGVYFVDTPNKTDETANLPLLKNSILSQLAASGYHYYTATEEVRDVTIGEGDDATTEQKTVKVFTQISPTDLKIVIADQQNKENSKNNCYVYAQLTETASKKTWYASNTQNAPILDDAANIINGKLKNKIEGSPDKYIIDRALVWKNGMTYYFYEIIHNQGDNTKGVVRNHVYDTRVTKIAGLGTPVYDPSQRIYPEKPDANDHYIAARIRSLSWRIVRNDYTLEW